MHGTNDLNDNFDLRPASPRYRGAVGFVGGAPGGAGVEGSGAAAVAATTNSAAGMSVDGKGINTGRGGRERGRSHGKRPQHSWRDGGRGGLLRPAEVHNAILHTALLVLILDILVDVRPSLN
ncbi:hypothetical protein IWX49DRAFT_558091 [Phyllosticta citricarpa]|uniref:Uncharacterized protein n=1 Tax=Phyllosticta citricarpa TaxID=55181 RepID=A0ABR1L4P6_9PEZI